MITLYSGTPGSGKVYASENLLHCVNLHKKLVITNYEINKDRLKDPELCITFDNSEITPQKLYEISDKFFEGKKEKNHKLCFLLMKRNFSLTVVTIRNPIGWLGFRSFLNIGNMALMLF